MHSLETLETKYETFLNSFNISEILKYQNNDYPKTLRLITHTFHIWSEHVIASIESIDDSHDPEIIETVADQLKDILYLEKKLKDQLLDAWIDK
jgi:hypothetical protein